MDAEVTNVEITEPVKPVEKIVPSKAELKTAGWSDSELEAAEKRGMIKAPEKKKEEEKEVKAEVKEVKVEEVKKSTLPDFTITDPEKERVFLETFGPGTPQHGTYLRMKSERRARQAAEARIKELELQLKSNETKVIEKPKVEIDEEGNEIDPDDKPLTLKQLEAREKQKAEEKQKQEELMYQRAQVVTNAQKEQEEYVKSIYPDFDETVSLAKEVMNNLDTLIPDEAEQEEIVDLIQQLQIKAANADKYGLNSFNAARVAYKIGSFHPNKGKAKNGGNADNNDGKLKDPTQKGNGTLTPEQMKRIEANTQRRASSASISGGGKRTVSSDEVGLAELNAMNYEQRQAFKTKYPDRYTKLLRG